MRRFGFGSLIALAIVGVAAAGCSSPRAASSAAASSSASAGGSIAVQLSEWKVVPTPATAPAGSVTFAVTNAGTMIHEFVVVQTDLKADALAVVDNKIDESVLTPVDEIEDIAVAATPSITVDLAAGHYVLLCNIETHYEQGMRADFDVN
jgi:uncharacterized cupredoxin-like copper-binding protein